MACCQVRIWLFGTLGNLISDVESLTHPTQAGGIILSCATSWSNLHQSTGIHSVNVMALFQVLILLFRGLGNLISDMESLTHPTQAGRIILSCSTSWSDLHRSTRIHCVNVMALCHVLIWLFRCFGNLISDMESRTHPTQAEGIILSCSTSDPIYTDLAEYILPKLWHPAKFLFDHAGAWVIWYLIWNLSLTPCRPKGSSCPAQPHDPMYPDLREYIVQVIKHPTESTFDHLRAWVIWHLICNLSITTLRQKGSSCPAKHQDPIYTNLQEYILAKLWHPAKSLYDYSGAWVLWYPIWNLSLPPHRLEGSSCPPQHHDSIYTDIQEYIVQVFRHLTKSSFDYSGALVIWYLICNLSLPPCQLEGSSCPTQPHDPIYTDLQEYILLMLWHCAKSLFDYSGAWVISYLIGNLSLIPHSPEGSSCPAQPHNPTSTNMQEYILRVFRHHTKSTLDHSGLG